MSEQCGCEYHPLMSKQWEHCRSCGRKPVDCGPISLRGRCLDCAAARASASAYQIAQRQGEHYKSYSAGLKKYAESL